MVLQVLKLHLSVFGVHNTVLDVVRGAVHLGERDNSRLLGELITEVEDDAEGDVDVVGDERPPVESAAEEGLVTVEEHDDAEGDQDDPSTIGLRPRLEGQLVTAEALHLHALVPTNVRQSNTAPSDQGAKSGDIREPVEGVVSAGLSASEVSEAGEESANGEGVDRDTVLHDLGEDARGLALLREHEKRTRARVQELVASGEGRGKDNRIDNVRQDFDTGGLDDDDERRLGGGTSVVLVGLEEGGLAPADAHADEENGEKRKDRRCGRR